MPEDLALSGKRVEHQLLVAERTHLEPSECDQDGAAFATTGLL